MNEACAFASPREPCYGRILKVGDKSACERHYEDAIGGVRWD